VRTVASNTLREMGWNATLISGDIGRKLFDGLPPQRFQLTGNVSSPAGYLLLDFQVQPV